jgi:tRNA(fMet)-specific endonuclease VapC
MVILDTDHLTLFFQGGIAGSRIKRRQDALRAGDIATAIVSYEEQTRGRLAFISKSRTMAMTIESYRHLHNHLRCFLRMPVADFTEAATVEFQRLRKLGLRIGTMDLPIAAVAISLSAVVLTRNTRDFDKVPGLRIEDWSKP